MNTRKLNEELAGDAINFLLRGHMTLLEQLNEKFPGEPDELAVAANVMGELLKAELDLMNCDPEFARFYGLVLGRALATDYASR